MEENLFNELVEQHLRIERLENKIDELTEKIEEIEDKLENDVIYRLDAVNHCECKPSLSIEEFYSYTRDYMDYILTDMEDRITKLEKSKRR